MIKRTLLCLLCLLCLCSTSLCEDTPGTYLDPNALEALQPSYEEFLHKTAQVLVTEGLLSEEDVADWIASQMADYYINGGSGSFVISYAPLQGVDSHAPSVSTCRLSCSTEAGEVRLDTLNGFADSYSTLPGLPLDVDLLDAGGLPIPCRFRWIADSGFFSVWDSSAATAIQVGAMFINEDRAMYWQSQVSEGDTACLTLDILDSEDDVTLATVYVRLICQDNTWIPKEVYQ